MLEFDVKGAFDNIDHELMLKAVRHHTDCRWTLLYIERWLKAPLIKANGERVERDKGTPQGGVISPLLFNLYLHYVFDLWMKRNFPHIPFVRYADDGLLHCNSQEEASLLQEEVGMISCGLDLHPEKTKIVYCRDANRRGKYPNIQFVFLGMHLRADWLRVEPENTSTASVRSESGIRKAHTKKDARVEPCQMDEC